jgi:hypothetical protein
LARTAGGRSVPVAKAENLRHAKRLHDGSRDLVTNRHSLEY